MAYYQAVLDSRKGSLLLSHGFAITWSDRTGVVPPTDIDVIMVAPKGSGTSLRTMFLEGRVISRIKVIEVLFSFVCLINYKTVSASRIEATICYIH